VAQRQIEKNSLHFGSVTEVFNSVIPSGFVISSSPNAGDSVKRNTAVNILVSKGIEQVVLNSYLAKSGDQALNELTDAGFVVVTKYVFDENVLAGAVIQQTPDGSAPVAKGAKVILIVSKGSEFVFIPNLYSLSEAKALKALSDIDLKVTVKKMGRKSVKNVTNIAPKVGSKVKRGSTVVITVG
jgi:serine/threonine-protein kinase